MTASVRVTVVLGAAGGLVAWLIQRAPDAPPPAAAPKAALTSVAKPPAVPTVRVGPPGARADFVARAELSSASDDPMLSLASGQTLLDLYQLEPRDPAFAGPREQALRDRLTERFRKRNARDVRVGVSCRTTCCEVTLEGGPSWGDINAAVYASEPEKLVETVMSSPLYDERGVPRLGVSIVLGFAAAQRDHDAYERVLAAHRGHDDDAP